MADKN